ncbi:MAG: hypothetical protein WEB00_12150 [Dehalococcoidia bacterium]
MKQAALAVFAVIAVAIAAASAIASEEALPDSGEGGNAGIIPQYYLKSLTGAGNGGANQTSSLTLGCEPEEAILAGGFGAVDVGTHVMENNIETLKPDSWRVAWRNDGTADSVLVRVICRRADPTRERITINGFGAVNQPTTVSMNCSGTELTGGFSGVGSATTVIAMAPNIDANGWNLTWTNPTAADTVKLTAYCWQSAETYWRGVSKRVAAGALGSISLSCFGGDVVAGIGFTSIEASDHLIGVRATDLRTATLSWRNGAAADSTGLKIVCLDVGRQ